MNNFLDKITELWNLFTLYSKSNPVIAGLVGLWGLGVATFFLRTIPSQIINFIKRQTTTTLILNSQDAIFFDLLRWVSKNKFHSFIRTLNFNNGQRNSSRPIHDGDENKTKMLTIGYGTIYFMHEGNFFAMTRQELDANQTANTKERITVTVLGRKHAPFKKLFEDIQESEDDYSKFTKIHIWSHNYWEFITRQYKRKMNTIVLDSNIKNNILNHIKLFHTNKEWYIENGVPYKTGILLMGPPGTGKTSLIKGLCAEFNKELFLLSLDSISDKMLQHALSNVPENSIVAIEDIDAFNINLKRNINSDDNDNSEKISSLTMAGLLNAIDGVITSENIILIATTNHPEKLDPALLREGRFDLKLTIGLMTDIMFIEYMKRFYPDFKIQNYKLKEPIAPCVVQKLVFENRNNPEKILEQLCIKEIGCKYCGENNPCSNPNCYPKKVANEKK